MSGQSVRQRAISPSVSADLAGARHAFQRIGMGVLVGDIEIGQQAGGRIGHYRDKVSDMGVGVDIMKANPGPQPAKFAGKLGDVAAHLAALPWMDVVAPVEPVGGGVLADNQQLAYPGLDQFLGLAQDGVGRAGGELSPHGRNDTEPAGVIAAFGNLQIGIMARRQGDATGGQQVDEGIGCGRHSLVDGVDHLFVLVRAGHGRGPWDDAR